MRSPRSPSRRTARCGCPPALAPPGPVSPRAHRACPLPCRSTFPARAAPLPPAASPALSYSSRLEFLADQVDSLTDFIGTARNSLEIALDSERNRMARLEL